MEVYIEAVIIDNFFITLISAILSYRILGKRASYSRSVIASIIGTIAAIIYPFISFSDYVLLLYKLLLCVILSCVLFIRRCNVIKGGGIFLMVTFFFGGALFCLSFMIHADAKRALNEPIAKIPIGLIIAVILLASLMIKKTSTRFKRLNDAGKFMAGASLTLFDKTIKLNAFMDTGNRLYDTATGLPVIIVSLKAIMSLLDEKMLADILCKRGECVAKGAHYISYSTLSSKNNSLLVLKPNAFRLYSDKGEHTIENIMVGLATSAISDVMEYDIILHPAVVVK